MRLASKIILILVIIFTLITGLVYIDLSFTGKYFIIKYFEGLTKRKVTIGSFYLLPPMIIKIKKINVEGLFKADYISCSPSLFAFLGGNAGFSYLRIRNPEFSFERWPQTQPSVEQEPPAAAIEPISSALSQPPASSVQGTSWSRLIFKRLKITGGKINITDHTAGNDGIKFVIKDIALNLNNFYTVPSLAVTKFDIKGIVPWAQEKEVGKISAEGWMDFRKKDMRAVLKFQDIDGIYLYPYYSQWVDLEKAHIQKAKLNFTSDINGLNNDVTAVCHLELKDIVFKEKAPEEGKERAEKIAYAVLDIFKNMDQGKVVLDFTIRTKMDNPRFGVADIKQALEGKLIKKKQQPLVGNVLLFPLKLLEGTVKGVADISRAAIDGTFAVGNELRKGLEGSAKKE